MESQTQFLKEKGQILIEGIFILVLFFSFLLSSIWTYETAKKQFQKERLQKKKQALVILQ